MDFVTLLPIFMFLALAILLFSGFPVAFVLGGVGLGFGFLGFLFVVFGFTEVADTNVLLFLSSII